MVLLSGYGLQRWRGKDRSAAGFGGRGAVWRATSSPDQITALIDGLRQMQLTPGSGIAMCYARGKAVVYLSRDRKYIVEHPPHGPITRTPVDLDK